ncbi:MAG TPA: tetratricopeptide repeat protein [Dyella sp.]|nr:tetratricopeptide repeat protein [Dyella sp.]
MAASLRLSSLLFAAALLAGCATAPGSTPHAPQLADVLTTQKDAENAYRAGDMDRAAKLYQQLTTMIPQEADYWFMLGNTYVRLQEPDAAVTAYQQAITRNPNHARAWHNLGIVRLRQAEAAFVSSASTARDGDPTRGLSSQLAEDLARIRTGDTASHKPPHEPLPAAATSTIPPLASASPEIRPLPDGTIVQRAGANQP